MNAPTILVWLFAAAIPMIAVFGIAVYRKMAAFPERRLQFEISLFVQLLGSIVFAAIVTYSIYIIQHAQQADEKHIADQKIAVENRARVLAFVKEELSYNFKAVSSRDGNVAIIQKSPLKSDFWRIAGLSGDLKWIDNVDQLNAIARAYFSIDQSVAWETRYIDATIGATSTINMKVGDAAPIPLKQYLVGLLSPSYVETITAIDAALKKL